MKPKDTMIDIPRRLKLLEKKLEELPLESEAMILGQLEGFLAGIIVCPDMIMPSKWLPPVWGDNGEDSEAVFESAEQAQQLIHLIMEHYNATITDINAGRYAPVYDVDVPHDETLWEIWIEGFEQAVALRPESWRAYFDAEDEDTQTAIAGLFMLIEVANNESKLERQNIDAIHATAPDLIPRWVEMLNAARVGQGVQSNPDRITPMTFSGKVGRNDLCPCGSGKKHKKCCGLN